MAPREAFVYPNKKTFNINRLCCGIAITASCFVIVTLPLIKVMNKQATTEDGDETESDILTTTQISIIDISFISNSEITTTTSTQVISNSTDQISTDNVLSYWTIDLPLIRQRSNYEAGQLANEKVMACGGFINSTIVTSACEFYLSSTGWVSGPSTRTIRYDYTLTLFANNTKLLAAGTAYSSYQQTAEVYDSENNTWKFTSTNMSTTRRSHTAVLLKNEQILIIGGKNSSSGSVISSADLYIPSSNSFIKTNSMNFARKYFTSTILNDGLTVLVTGGADINNNVIGTAELYISGSWILTNSNMIQLRAYHAAVLLNDGNILIAGGGNGGTDSYSTAEIYSPTTRIFASVGSMKYRRAVFTLTLLPSGKVLATGGIDWTTQTFPVTCELYDPLTQTWSNTRILNNGRYGHRSVLLNDSVLTIGGDNGGYNKLSSYCCKLAGQINCSNIFIEQSILNGVFNSRDKSKIFEHSCALFIFVVCVTTSVLLLIKIEPNSETGDTEDNIYISTSTPISIDTTTLNNNQTKSPSDNSLSYWMRDASLSRQRAIHDAVLLADGKVLVTGGVSILNILLQTSEVYSSSSGWQGSSLMKNKRFYHTLISFANNTKVLATGSAYSPDQQTAEIYDSEKNTWTSTSTNMLNGRFAHGATLLSNGKILIMGGGDNSGSSIPNAELYSPSEDSFTSTSNMNIGRLLFVSTLLNDGSTVLITGGGDAQKRMTKTAELYISGSWIFTNGNMTQPRAYHAAVLLKDGNVLIAGGGNGNLISYATAEIYNTTARTFASVESMKYRRGLLTLTLLPSGKVLATGGIDWTTQTNPAISELYDPVTQTWSNVGMLNNGRHAHKSILLNDSVLTIGGVNVFYGPTSTCEKYNF